MQADVEKNSYRRRIILMLMASAFLAWQVPAMDYFERLSASTVTLADGISVAGFLIWGATLMYLLATGRKFVRKNDAAVVAALEDELVRSNRRKAFMCGYIVAMVSAGTLFVASMLLPISGKDAAHIVLVLGVVAPMYTFVYLERANA